MDFLIIVHKERLQIMSASPAVVPQDREKQLEAWSETCDSVVRTELDKELSRLGDGITTKVRKPYTITKQRERWTDEEHQKFLEALKLYGRAWRQIEEHVGTKTAVQIRSHAQKFFSKMEREGSSGSKEPVSEIEIPPPRPKRKPAHPYPRKGVTLSSKGASIKSRSLKVSRRKSSDGELSLDFDNAVDVMKTNKSPASNVLEMDDLHLRNCSSKNSSCVSVCQKPRKRGTEEVQCEAFPNEAQEMPKLSRSTCNQPEVTSSPIGILACQPDSLMLHNNTMPFGVCGSKLLTTFQQMAVPYHHPMHSLAALQSAAAALLNSATANPNQLGKLKDVPTMASFFTAHAHLTSSLMPWINLNPMAFAAAAAAAATTPWPGLGPQPAPLHLPLRPSAIFNDKINAESSSTVATAMVAAAAASFVDASAWLPLHGNFSRSPNASEVRSLFKPNPVVHSSLIEGRQHRGNSLEGSKNGDNECQQISSEEHEEASTVDGMPETIAHVNHPSFMAGDYAIPSAHHPQKSFYHCEKETLMDQDIPGHNSSTDSSSNGKKGKKRNGLNGTWSNFLLLQSKNGLQNPAYLTVKGKKLGKPSIKVHNGETDSSPSVYQGSNSPKSGISPKIIEGYGEGYAYKGKLNNRLDALTTTVHVTDSTIEEHSGSSVCKTKDCVAPHCITNTLKSETQVEVDVSMRHENGSSRMRHEDISGEASITDNQRQCISSCGSTENKKAEAHDPPVTCSKIKDTETKESGPKHHTEDSGSEVTPYEKAGKVLVQACLTRWQGGEIMFTHTCTNPKSIVATPRGNSTCRAEAKEMDTHQEDARSSLGMGLSKQRLPFVQPQSVHGSKASSSGSSKYTGHGFVPYRRS